MKKLHIAAITVSGLAAAMVGRPPTPAPPNCRRCPPSPLVSNTTTRSTPSSRPSLSRRSTPACATAAADLIQHTGAPFSGCPCCVRAPGLGTAISRSCRFSLELAGLMGVDLASPGRVEPSPVQ